MDTDKGEVANLTIPDEYQQGILKLFLLDASDVSVIRNVLSTEADDISARELAAIVAPSLETVSEKDIYAILRSLRALYIVRSTRDVSISEFVSDLADAVEELASEDFTAERLERFRMNVASLMAIDPFAVQIKGRDLQTEDERTFCRARILTDLRPVFGDTLEDGVRGMVIIHHLKLGFHKDGPSHTDFHLALDSEDLLTLKAVIERAEEKAKILRAQLSGTRFLGL